MSTDKRAPMDADAAAEYLSISKRKLYEMQAEGKVAVVRFGRRTLYLQADLDDLIARHRVER